MRVLIDECLPRKLKFLFAAAGHDCVTVRDAGFGGKENGELLAIADGKFDVLIAVDKNIRHQQNIPAGSLAVLVIRALSNDLDDLRRTSALPSRHCSRSNQEKLWKSESACSGESQSLDPKARRSPAIFGSPRFCYSG